MIKRQEISLARRFLISASKSKGYLLLIMLYALSIYLYLRLKKQRRIIKKQADIAHKISRVRAIMREVIIEANFSQRVAHIKYKDKQVKSHQDKT